MSSPATAVRRTALVVGVAYALALYLSGVHLQAGPKQVLGYLPTLAVAGLTMWDLWLWRWPIVRRLAGRPLLRGTWRATLKPTIESHIPAGGNRGPIEAYMIIHQTYWSISIVQYTAESRSESRAAMWQDDAGGSRRSLTFTYGNTPRQEFEARSGAHLGTTKLEAVGGEPTVLSGYYFTDRYTKGDMALELVDRTVDHASFESAQGRAHRP